MSIDGRLQLTLADLTVDSPAIQGMRAEHEYSAFALARDSLTALRNQAHLLPIRPGRRRVLAVLLDDDDDPRREELFRERIADFRGGFVRRTSADAERAADDSGLLLLSQEADLVFAAVACSIRAYKGRAGIHPELARILREVLRVAASKTVVVLLSGPEAIHEIDPPATVVAAWGDAPVCIRAAIDVVLSGGPLRGLDPAGSGTA
jgi:hypothetical protein